MRPADYIYIDQARGIFELYGPVIALPTSKARVQCFNDGIAIIFWISPRLQMLGTDTQTKCFRLSRRIQCELWLGLRAPGLFHTGWLSKRHGSKCVLELDVKGTIIT